jgi:hypothetical protein
MTMLGAKASYRLGLRLFKMFGPSLGAVFQGTGKEKIEKVEDIDLSSESMVSSITALTRQLTESDFDHLVDQLQDVTHVGLSGATKTVPMRGIFEDHFSGDIGGMIRWLAWGLMVQYRTFSSVFATLKLPVAGDAKQEAATPTQ